MIYTILMLFSLFLFSYSQENYPISLSIGNQKYDFFYRSNDDINNLARNFCINKQDELGYNKNRPLTESNINECILPVANGIRRQLPSNIQSTSTTATTTAAATSTAAASTSTTVGDLYQVQVPVNGNVFEVSFRPASERYEAVARNFCISQRNLIGYTDSNPLTDANLPDCVAPIAQYLQTSVDKFQREQQQTQQQAQAPVAPPAPPTPKTATPTEVKVRITVEGNQYEITLREGQYIADIARQFCIEQASTLGYSASNPLTEQNIGGCVTPVATYLQNTLAEYNSQQRQQATATAPQQTQTQAQQAQPAQQAVAPQDKLVSIRVRIDPNTYEVRFNPEKEPILQVAQNFCVTQSESLGLTSETLPGCVGPVAEYLRQSLKQSN